MIQQELPLWGACGGIADEPSMLMGERPSEQHIPLSMIGKISASKIMPGVIGNETVHVHGAAGGLHVYDESGKLMLTASPLPKSDIKPFPTNQPLTGNALSRFLAENS